MSQAEALMSASKISPWECIRQEVRCMADLELYGLPLVSLPI